VGELVFDDLVTHPADLSTRTSAGHKHGAWDVREGAGRLARPPAPRVRDLVPGANYM